jgi:hypothetical protein
MDMITLVNIVSIMKSLLLTLVAVSETTRKLTIGTNSDLEFSSMSPKSTCRQQYSELRLVCTTHFQSPRIH